MEGACDDDCGPRAQRCEPTRDPPPAPCHGDDSRYAEDPYWKDLVLFHEYFHGDTGRGVGASHQTGWTALVLRAIEDTARMRDAAPARSPRKATPALSRP
jgi:hypothetical protein